MPEATQPQTTTPAERLHDALLSFAHACNSSLHEIVFALRAVGEADLAADLEGLRSEWTQAAHAFVESIGQQDRPLSEETAAEDVRNALQLLSTMHGDDLDLSRARLRLQSALRKMEGR